MIEKLRKIFFTQYPQACTPLIVKSPGRINIIGEHTDYNEGFVLPAAIDKAAYFAISHRNDDTIQLYAADLNDSYSTAVLNLQPVACNTWANYVLGVVAQFVKKGVAVKGFNAVLMSDVPIGAGLSSSAAIECAVVFALNELLQTRFDRFTMVKMAQAAEHEYAGVLCGIMDQFASMMGKKDHVIRLDCRSLEYEYIPFKLDGYKILLLNTNVKHSLASSEYNIRRAECNEAVQLVKAQVPGVNSLRDVTEQQLNDYVLPKSTLIDRRSRYVVQEINRLLEGCQNLKEGNIKGLGQKMFDTHKGLSQYYDVSCKELDFLVDAVRDNPAVVGARMMGGGFGGCTINIVKEETVDYVISKLAVKYEAAMQLPLTSYIASVGNGTEIV